MRCDKIRERIELSSQPLFSLSVLAHLATCAECRAHHRRIAQLYRTARTLPRPEPQAGLTARIATALPTEQGIVPVKHPRPIILRAAIAGMVVLAVAWGLLSGPHSTPLPVSAATIQNAIQETNTWHLSGWRLENDQKVPWEVWGRRKPFFYREQIGDQILLDDGVSRVHIIPPNERGFRRQGLHLIMPSHPMTAGNEASLDTHAAFLHGLGEEYIKDFSLAMEDDRPTGNTAVLKTGTSCTGVGLRDGTIHGVGEVGMLTVDRHTRLPIRYQLKRSMYKKGLEFFDKPEAEQQRLKEREWIQASLDAEYNVALPAAAMTVNPPTGYQKIDFAGRPTLPTDRSFGVAAKDGVTVATRALAADAEGNVRLQTLVYLGDTLLSWPKQGMAVQVGPTYGYQSNEVDKQYPTDGRGNVYLHINEPDADWDRNFRYATPETPKETYEINYLTPAEPLLPHHHRAESLTVPLRVTAMITEPMEGGGTRQRNVVEEDITVTVPLPRAATSLDYDRPRGNPEGIRWGDHIQHSLLWETAMVRRSYWYDMAYRTDLREQMATGTRVGTIPPSRKAAPYRAKHHYWTRVFLEESERLGDSKTADEIRREITQMAKEEKQ